jgi:hypothetical protein
MLFQCWFTHSHLWINFLPLTFINFNPSFLTGQYNVTTLYLHKLAITSQTRGGRSVGIVRSRTQTMEFSLVFPMRVSLYLHKLAITSPTSGGRSVGIVRSRTQTMEFSLVFLMRVYNTRTSFRKLDLCLPSGEWRDTATLLGPLERANLNRWSSGRCVF